MNQNTTENPYPIRSVMIGISTAVSTLVISLGYDWLGKSPLFEYSTHESEAALYGYISSGLSFAFSVVIGYLVFVLVRENENAKSDLDQVEREVTFLETSKNTLIQERKEDLNRFERMLKNIPRLLFSYELPGFKQYGEFRFISEDVVTLTGHSSKDILSNPGLFIERIHSDDLAEFHRSGKEAVEKKADWDFTFRFSSRSQGERRLRVLGRLGSSEDGHYCFDGIFADVTSEWMAREQEKQAHQRANDLNLSLQSEVSRANAMMVKAEKAQSESEEMIRNFSHEVRTTINGVQGVLDMLLSKGLTGEQREHAIEGRQTVQALLPVIGDLIDHTYIRSGSLVLEMAPFDLRTLVEQSVSMFSSEAKRAGIALNIKWDEQIPEMLEGDAPRIRQVLYNLLSNAVQFTETGSITTEIVCSGRAGKYTFVRFHVKDTGRGIDSQARERFFTQSVALNHEKDKTLGIPLSRNLVELMGGKLQVNSEEGSGSDIYFVLRLQEATEVIPEKVNEKEAEAFQPLRVLVAEDVLVNQKICKYRMESLGHQVAIVDNGQDALEKLAQEDFDFVLMDCEMPIMDGYEATTAIRGNEFSVKNSDIYIVAVTANAMNGDRKTVFDCGMNEYISKPFSQKDVEAAAHRAFNHILKHGGKFALSASDAQNQRKSGTQIPGAASNERMGKRFINLENVTLKPNMSKEETDALLSLTSGKKPSKEK